MATLNTVEMFEEADHLLREADRLNKDGDGYQASLNMQQAARLQARARKIMTADIARAVRCVEAAHSIKGE